MMLSLGSGLYYLKCREPSLRMWQQVFSRPIPMVAAMIMAWYVVMGLLDSLHFQSQAADTQGQVYSALDYIFWHLAEYTEKSFSAPFACVGFSKESFLKGTQWVYDYPSLHHACQSINGPKTWDILKTIFIALMKTILVMTVIWHLKISSMRTLTFLRTPSPKRIFWLTLSLLVLITFLSFDLSQHYHILGTDKVGQDVFFHNIKSIRTGLVIGTVTLLFMLPFAIVFGLAAGFFKGWVDDVIQYLYTTLSAIPSVLLISAAVLSVQVYLATHAETFANLLERSDIRLLFLCMILGVTGWAGLCRLLRAEALKLRDIEFMQAAKALGATPMRLIFNHLLPNVMHIILISAVLDFSGLVLSEAVLSYVGVGVDPSTYSWGNMINSARLEMARVPVVWWSLVSTFIFMFVLVLSANILADAIRDAIDPRMQKRPL